MAKTPPDWQLEPRHRQIVSNYVGTTPPLELIPPHPQRSIRTLTHDYPSEICGWHCHPEYEIHLITKTSGSVIVGDHIGTFEPGQISICGPNLPHDWVSDLQPGEMVPDRDAVIQFTDEWIHQCMTLIPELENINEVLDQSRRGLCLSGQSAADAGELMLEVVKTSGPQQVGLLFELLALFARSAKSDRILLAGEWLDPGSDEAATRAVEEGMNYIFENLTGTIRLSTAASLAHMSEPTFSRYFKKASGMTFSDMVKKLRIAHACRLLDSTNDPIAIVADASGYNNLANFNRQFLSEVGMTPRDYRRLDAQQRPSGPILSRGLRAPEEALEAIR